jgi:hypothetical protein
MPEARASQQSRIREKVEPEYLQHKMADIFSFTHLISEPEL